MLNVLHRFIVLGLLLIAGPQDAFSDLNVYHESTWTFALRGGVAPSAFNGKGLFTVTTVAPGISLPASTTDDVTTATAHQRSVGFKLSDAYVLPFALNAEIGNFIADNWEIFLNFDFIQSCNRSLNLSGKTVSTNNAFTTEWGPRDLNAYAFNFGTRYYLCYWPVDCLMPFIGGKLGGRGTTYCSGDENVTISVDDGRLFTGIRETNKKCTYFTAGLQLGFDFVLDDNFALSLMGEAIATFGDAFKGDRQHLLSVGQDLIFTNVSKTPDAIYSFPLTVGFKLRI